MKRIVFLLLICCLPTLCCGQTSDSLTVDLLRAPSSPAFNILGISPSVIERPTDLNAFRVSVQNASSQFTQLPTSYSVEVAPANLARIGGLTLASTDMPKFGKRFWQTFSVSCGISRGNSDDRKTADSSAFTKMGIGIKFSIFRPGWSDRTRQNFQALQAELNKQTHGAVVELIDDSAYKSLLSAKERIKDVADSLIKVIRKTQGLTTNQIDSLVKAARRNRNEKLKEIDPQLESRMAVVLSHSDTGSYNALKRAIGNFRIDRKGWFLDFAGGLALDFPDDRFNYSLTSKSGVWLTGGFDNSEAGWSVLLIGRYLYQPNRVLSNNAGEPDSARVSLLDAGARLVYTAPNGKFSLGEEGVYRSVLNPTVIQPSWRFTLNADYDVGLNKKITFAFGRNFDGTTTKGGNIIAVLNFIAGFGSQRKFMQAAR